MLEDTNSLDGAHITTRLCDMVQYTAIYTALVQHFQVIASNSVKQNLLKTRALSPVVENTQKLFWDSQNTREHAITGNHV